MLDTISLRLRNTELSSHIKYKLNVTLTAEDWGVNVGGRVRGQWRSATPCNRFTGSILGAPETCTRGPAFQHLEANSKVTDPDEGGADVSPTSSW